MAGAGRGKDLNRHRRVLGRAASAHDEAQDAVLEAQRLLILAVIDATAAGLSTREIAEIVGLSHTTVATMARLAEPSGGVDI